MTTHSPTPTQIRTARLQAHLTVHQAAQLCHLHRNTWTQYENGTRTPHPAIWELFTLKTAQNSDN